MQTATKIRPSPMASAGKFTWYGIRLIVLCVLFFGLFVLSGQLVAPYLPVTAAEPGPFGQMTGVLVVTIASTLVAVLMIESSGWHGLKLVGAMALSYYVAVTLVTQLEAWYFLYGNTVGPELMPRLFLQGLPVAVLFIPLAVIILGRIRPTGERQPAAAARPWTEWLWKLSALIVVYWVLYYVAGYFIAWLNPDVRAFYGQPGPAVSFLTQMRNNLIGDPWLTPYQALRSLIWIGSALPIIRGSRWSLWWTALVVGLLFSVPQNIGHILPNPLIPSDSVRMSHLIETASSTFIFGVIVTWLLYRKQR